MNTTEFPIVRTKALEEVKKKVGTAIRESGILAIPADIGSGKSTLFKYLTGYWNLSPEKYKICEMKGFTTKDGNSRISFYIQQLIMAIEPDAHIPVGVEARYETLRLVLIRAHNKKMKVIFIVDEAQDLSLQTHRDLKKIHEINLPGRDHLFTIILLGKPIEKWTRILESIEIGFRVTISEIGMLTDDEMIEISNVRFGVRFEKISTRQEFISRLIGRNKIPLAVEFACKLVSACDNFAGVVTEDIMNRAQSNGAMRLAKARGIKDDVIASEYQNLTGKTVSKSSISKNRYGKLDPDSALSQQINQATLNVIEKHMQYKQAI